MEGAELSFSRECPDGEGVASAGEELTLSGRLTPEAVEWGRGWNVCPRIVLSSQPDFGCVRLLFIYFRGVCGCLSLCLFVVVPSPWLVRTPGVGEGYSCPKARVKVRVDRASRLPAPGEQVCECGVGTAGRREGQSSGKTRGKFRGTRGERCVG